MQWCNCCVYNCVTCCRSEVWNFGNKFYEQILRVKFDESYFITSPTAGSTQENVLLMHGTAQRIPFCTLHVGHPMILKIMGACSF